LGSELVSAVTSFSVDSASADAPFSRPSATSTSIAGGGVLSISAKLVVVVEVALSEDLLKDLAVERASGFRRLLLPAVAATLRDSETARTAKSATRAT